MHEKYKDDISLDFVQEGEAKWSTVLVSQLVPVEPSTHWQKYSVVKSMQLP